MKNRSFLFLVLGVVILSCDSTATDKNNSKGSITLDEAFTKANEPSTVISPVSVTVEESFYNTVSLYDGKLKVFVPQHFAEMSEEKVQLKYPNARNRPDVIYTNENATVNLVFSHTANQGSQEVLPDMLPIIESQLQSTNPQNFKSRIEKINGHDYIVFEFISNAFDTKIYNLMFVTDLNEKILIGTFNCTVQLQEEWESKAKEILASLQKS